MVGSLFVSIAGLLVHGDKAKLQLSLSSILGDFYTNLESFRCRLGAETLDVVGDEGWARKSLALSGHDSLTLGLSYLLQQPLNSLGARCGLEAVDDAAGGKVEKCLAVLLQLLVGIGASVQCLDIFIVELERSGSIFDNLLPLMFCVEARSAV